MTRNRQKCHKTFEFWHGTVLNADNWRGTVFCRRFAWAQSNVAWHGTVGCWHLTWKSWHLTWKSWILTVVGIWHGTISWLEEGVQRGGRDTVNNVGLDKFRFGGWWKERKGRRTGKLCNCKYWLWTLFIFIIVIYFIIGPVLKWLGRWDVLMEWLCVCVDQFFFKSSGYVHVGKWLWEKIDRVHRALRFRRLSRL